MRDIRNRRALSPVIATVILVAVAITVAVAVAYWMGGIAGQYTKFEKIEIQSAPCVWDSEAKQWNITLTVKNTGTSQATLDKVFINGIEVDSYQGDKPGDDQATADTDSGLVLTSGYTDTILVQIKGGPNGWQDVSSGTTVNIKLHSTGGMEYLKLVELV